MFKPVTVKVCGLTREADVDKALELGADYLGFILYADSPRSITFERATDLLRRVPVGKRVFVDVETRPEDLQRAVELGFDYFQIHARLEVGLATLATWSGLAKRERLWLAPRVSQSDSFPEAVVEFADTILVDTYSKKQVGGTGQTGDWGRFAKWKEAYSQVNFILAGGLSPENIASAIALTGANHVDVNSGVESAPGIKDHQKLEELFIAVNSCI